MRRELPKARIGGESRLLSDVCDSWGCGRWWKRDVIDTARGIVADCKSGASGAGKEPKKETHFVAVNGNFRAYGVFSHRHTPEVAEHTGLAAKDFVFTTHLLPVERGILSTMYVWLKPKQTADAMEAVYKKYLRGTSAGEGVRGGRLAGIAARNAHEFLRYRLRAGCIGREAGGRELPGQSGQRRGGTSSTKL